MPAEHLYLSAVTVGEIQAGIEIKRGQDPARAEDLEGWLDQVLSTYSILSVDAAAFREWARLMHRQPRRLLQDALIAAVAVVKPSSRTRPGRCGICRRRGFWRRPGCDEAVTVGPDVVVASAVLPLSLRR